jgi:hypothetical protein
MIYVETDELGTGLLMRWVTATLPGHDENGARGPYTWRNRTDVDGRGVTEVFASIAELFRLAHAQGVRPVVNPGILDLLNKVAHG